MDTADHIHDEGLTCRICKELPQLKDKLPIKTWAKDLNSYLSKEKTDKWPINILKDAQHH